MALVVFMAIFFDVDPAKSFPLLQAARTVTQQLGEVILEIVRSLNAAPGLISSIIERLHHHTSVSKYGTHMIEQLLKIGYSKEDLVWTQLQPSSRAMVANQAQLFAQCLDYYLSDEGAPHLKEIHRLAKLDTDEADELILR